MARRKKLGCTVPLLAAVLLTLAADGLLGEQDAPSAATPAPPAAEHAPKAPKATRAPTAVQSPFPAGSPWESREACEAALQRNKPQKPSPPRIGTWNLAWFPAGTASGDDPERARDVAWMACIVATLGVQVLAVQEVVQHPAGRAAMLDLLAAIGKHTGGRWRAELDDCPDDGRQHVGFLYDESRVELLGARTVAELNPLRSACHGRLRPGLAAHFRYRRGGPDFGAVAVHLDSGTLARDYEHRKTSIERLAPALDALRKEYDDRDLLVLGDFNTMGCTTCNPKVSADEEIAALDARIDAFTQSVRNLAPAQPCSHYYRGHGGRLDHVLVTRAMQELAPSPSLQPHGLCGARRCERISSAAKLPATLKLSDHCPVVLTLRAADQD